jgi:hypothetical protein
LAIENGGGCVTKVRAEFNQAQHSARLSGVEAHQKQPASTSAARFAAPAILAALLCTGCPVGADLDAPYNEYVLVDNTSSAVGTQDGSTGSTSTTTAGGTTGGAASCANEAPDVVFKNCAHAICHGTPGMASPELTSGLDLFAPDVRTAVRDRPGSVHATGPDCSAELVVNTANPAASLLITTLEYTAGCGVEMPVGIKAKPEEIQCVTEWVNAVAAGL